MQTIVELPSNNLLSGEVYSQPPLTQDTTTQERLMTPSTDTRISADLEWAILDAVSQLYLLTAEQLSRLLGYSYRYVQLGCQRLTARGMLEQLVVRRQTRHGTAPYIYTLGLKGYHSVKDHGSLPPMKRYRSIFERVHEDDPVIHTLAVNEFLLPFLILEKTDPNVTVEFIHELELNANPLRVSLPDTEKAAKFSPDGFVKVNFLNPPDTYCYQLEVYTSKFSKLRWQQKVHTYLHSFEAYKEYFETSHLDGIAVSVQSKMDFPKIDLTRLTAREQATWEYLEKKRAERFGNFLKWTSESFTAHNIPPSSPDADLFLFSQAPLTRTTPQELLYGAHWQQPVTNAVKQLLPEQEATS